MPDMSTKRSGLPSKRSGKPLGVDDEIADVLAALTTQDEWYKVLAKKQLGNAAAGRAQLAEQGRAASKKAVATLLAQEADALVVEARAEAGQAAAAKAAREWHAALDHYRAALACVPPDRSGADVAPMHANASLASLKLGKAQHALDFADAAAAEHPGWAKAHGRRGEALEALERPEQAAAAFDEAARLDPAAFGRVAENARGRMESAGRSEAIHESEPSAAGVSAVTK